jgi:hypothetical protein
VASPRERQRILDRFNQLLDAAEEKVAEDRAQRAKVEQAVNFPRARCPQCSPLVWYPCPLPWCPHCGHPMVREEVRV